MVEYRTVDPMVGVQFSSATLSNLDNINSCQSSKLGEIKNERKKTKIRFTERELE